MAITPERQRYNKAYKAEYQARTHRIAVTLTEAEYVAFTKQATAYGKKPTTLANELILTTTTGRAVTPEIVREELSELRFLLRNVANNLNQIAHHSNTIRRVVDDNAVLAEVQKMEEAIYDFVGQRLAHKPPHHKTT
jgi:hypothetical protein